MFGTDAASLFNVSSGRQDTSHTLTGLDYGTVYYWRIVAFDGKLGNSGPLWSFTTQAVPLLKGDSLALVALYNSTAGAGWTDNSNWLTGNLSTWKGVTVAEGRVTQLVLNTNNLVGPLPPEIGDLTGLQKLVLYMNNISGAIPAELGNLTKLDYLALNINQLSGTIPAELGSLTALVQLELDNNQLSGAIPAELGNLANLQNLKLNNNQLSGTIPAALGGLQSLMYLILNTNRLSGAVPVQLHILNSLQYLYLHDNALTDLPDLSSLSNLTNCKIENNRFTFEDIEPNIGAAGVFTYSPQDSVGLGYSNTINAGDTVSLAASGGASPNNRYQWKKDGIPILGATQSVYTITSATVSHTGVYTCDVTNTVAAGLTLYRRPISVLVIGGLAGFWKFDEGGGSTAADFSGNGNTGTLVNAPVWTAGKVGRALDFNGQDAHVVIAANPALDNLNAVTMAAWIYPRADLHWHVLDKGDGDKRLYAEGQGAGVSRRLVGRVRCTLNHAAVTSVDSAFALDAWQHVAMTWSVSDNTARVYHNGKEVAYSNRTVGSGTVLDDTGYPYTIGARGGLGSVTFFDGLMDEVRLYNRVLSPQEIAVLYNAVATTTVTFQYGVSGYVNTEDAMIRSDLPDANSGTGINFPTISSSGMDTRGVVKFDMSSVPRDAGIISATLSLYCDYSYSSAGNITTGVYELKRSDWTETGVTWNSYDSSLVWSNPGGDLGILGGFRYITGIGHYDFDVTGIVRAQLGSGTFSALVKHINEDHSDVRADFRSREVDVIERRPKLTIVY
jgi:hypothetical protein